MKVSLALAALAALPGTGWAQEAMYTQAATMPSKGVVVVRPQLNFSKYGASPGEGVRSTERLDVLTSLQLGIARSWSVTAELPVAFDREERDDGSHESLRGVEDIGLTFKYRVYKKDTGGVDTVRAALLGGVHIPSGDNHDFSGSSIDPHIGAVITVVRGRHGFDQDLMYRFNSGGDDSRNLGGGEGGSDALFHNTAYLFRISPETYTAETVGSYYATIELNGIYETNGDYELRWSPGFMFEGRSFAIEVMAQFPLYHDLSERAELDYSVGAGVRWTF